jgi:uncharacterized lipoprotein
MLVVFLRFCLLSIMVLLAGCSYITGKNSYFYKRDTAYLQARETPSLQLPCGVSGANIGDDYVIPPVSGPIPTQPISIIPPGSLAAQKGQH